MSSGISKKSTDAAVRLVRQDILRHFRKREYKPWPLSVSAYKDLVMQELVDISYIEVALFEGMRLFKDTSKGWLFEPIKKAKRGR